MQVLMLYMNLRPIKEYGAKSCSTTAILSISRLVWEKGSLSTSWQKKIRISTISVSKCTQVFCALERREQTELNNLFFIRFDAKYLLDIFDQEEVDRIYLNFSDPWPKDRHAKRRLTSPNFLSLYHIILAKKGYIQFKTDNRPLFDFSVESVEESNLWHIDELTYDLHNSEFLPGNIMTEYESRFVAEGKPICRFKISR